MRASFFASTSVLVLTALVCLASGHGISMDRAPDPLCLLAVSLILFVLAALRRPRPLGVQRSTGVATEPALERGWLQE